MYGLSTLCTSARMMEGGTDLFSLRHPDKDGDWEGTEDRDSAASPCLALHLCWFILFYLFTFLFVCFVSLRSPERERCLLNCCAAPWLWSCMSTLWAPISATMTGITWFNEWHPARSSVLLFSPSLQVVLVLTRGVLSMGSNSSCCQNCQWTATATKTFKRAELFFYLSFFNQSINQTSGLPEGNHQFNTSSWCFKEPWSDHSDLIVILTDL